MSTVQEQNPRKKAVILLAHGSRDKQWQAPFFAMADKIKVSMEKEDSEHSTLVELAFMELATPTLEEVVHTLFRQGVDTIEVLPLFFAEGRHLRQDVPKQIEQLHEQYDIEISLQAPVGQSETVISAIQEVIFQQLT